MRKTLRMGPGLRYVGLIGLILFTFQTLSRAQSDRGTITGVVSDPQGRPIPAAAIVAINEATGTENHTSTTGTGDYTIPGLPAATYSVTVEAPGFSKLVRNGITVSVNVTARVDAALTVGSTSATVTVTADAPLLKTENPENNITVTTGDINDLPLDFGSGQEARNPLTFAEMAPGTVRIPTSQGGWNSIHIDGTPGTTFRVLLDGQDSGSGLASADADEQQASVEATQEFTLMQDSSQSEFGQTAGGIFNLTTKSGSNAIHGSAYEYLQNEDLDAAKPFSGTAAHPANVNPVNKQHDFGFSFGGPVYIPKLYDGRNRTFFFFNWEMYRYHVGTQGTYTVPTAAEVQGDFSYLLTLGAGKVLGTDPLGRPIISGTLYDPATTRTVNGQVVRDPFPSNYVNPKNFDSVSAKILTYLPKPTSSDPTFNYQYQYLTKHIEWLPSIKIDHNFTPNIHLAGYYSSTANDKDNGQDGLPDPVSERRYQQIRAHTVRFNADDILTPTVVLHVGVGYQRYYNPDSTPLTSFNQSSQLGLPGALVGGFPQIQNLNINNQSMPNLGPGNYNLYVLNKPTYVASVSWIKSAHTLKFGGEYRHESWLNQSSLNALGNYQFSSQQTSLPSTNGQGLSGGFLGNSLASFLLGQTNGESIGDVVNPRFVRGTGGFYGEDTWKITHKLTITYGARYDLEQLQHEQKYRTTMFSPTVANPSAGGLLGGALYEGYGVGRCNCVFEHFWPYAIQPRIGVTYAVDNKTVVHAASGIFYAQQRVFNYASTGNSLGFGWNTASQSTPGYGLSAGQLSAGIPYSAAQLYATTFDPGARPNAGQINTLPSWFYPNNGRPPRVWQTNIGIQRSLTKDMTLEADYVGVRGTQFEANGLININQVTPQILAAHGLDVTTTAAQNLLRSTMASPTVAAAGFTVPYAGFPTGQTLAQALKPYPQFSSVGIARAMVGNYWYDSLQVKLQRRMAKGLWVLGTYTWSKDLGTVSSETGGTVPISNTYGPPKSQKTYESIDRPQILNISYRYEIPTFGFAQSGWKRTLLAGWTTTGILNYQSGSPITAPGETNNFNGVLGAGGGYAVRVPGQSLLLHSVNSHSGNPRLVQFLNPAAWTNLPIGANSIAKPYYGNFRNPRYPAEQMGLGKVTKIHEGLTFSIRADLFNVFNRWAYPNLGAGDFTAPTTISGTGVYQVANGFGYVGGNVGSIGSYDPPRHGQIVARIQF